MSYHRLLMLYRGEEKADALLASAPDGLDAATIGYGVGNYHLYNGRRDQATAIFRSVVDKQPTQWPAFGYVASEAELARDSSAKK
jgi:hypothetical protein